MVSRHGSQLGSQLCSPVGYQFVGVNFWLQPPLLACQQNVPGLLYRKRTLFAEYVAKLSQLLPGHSRDHLFDDDADKSVRVSLVLHRHRMGTHKR
ncbi:hypothetical protein D3C75_1090700 [compost metagenome]